MKKNKYIQETFKRLLSEALDEKATNLVNKIKYIKKTDSYILNKLFSVLLDKIQFIKCNGLLIKSFIIFGISKHILIESICLFGIYLIILFGLQEENLKKRISMN